MLKYIIFTEAGGAEAARLGLAPITHKEMALEAQNYRHGRTIVAAAFVEFVNGEARVFGASIGLEMGPRKEDALFLSTFYRQGALAAQACTQQPATPAHHG